MNRFPRKIVVFGPSTVYGKNDPEGGFVARLRRHAEAESDKNIIFNLGVSGESSEEMRIRFQAEVAVRNPALIIFYPGLNDLARRGGRASERLISRSRTIANWQEILTSAKGICRTMMILPLLFDEQRTTPFVADYYYYRSDFEEHYTDLKQVCAECDIQALENLFTAADVNDYLSEDGMHFNGKGHQQILEAILSKITDKQG